jgi:hypothetical protein
MSTSPKRKSAKISTSAKLGPNRSRTPALSPPAGPVTLAEARALALARQPRRAAQKATTVGSNPVTTSPERVGKELEKLERRRREELARRIQEYSDTMAVMKAHGAKAPQVRRSANRGRGAAAAAADEGFAPLQILAEGDSWFDYPVPFFGGGIIPRLQDRVGVPILNLAKAGDEVRYMLGVEERAILADQLRQGCPNGGPWEVLLFSGGGNDIVGDPMALWVRDWNPTIPPTDHIHGVRFEAALAMVRAGYEDLIALRDRLSPNTYIFFHGYDFAIPDGRGICHLGPWLKPTFDVRDFPSRSAGVAVVQAMLRKFAEMLTTLAQQPNVAFINTQGTLPPRTSAWHNELHPTSAGFDKFAALFHQELRIRFQGRVA